MKKTVLIVLIAIILHGCGYGARKYQPSMYTYKELQGISNANKVTISVGPIEFSTPDLFNPTCRAAGPILLPNEDTFNNYIRSALISEFKLADMYDISSPCSISGTITEMNFDSWANGSWDIGIQFTTSTEDTFFIKTEYAFRGTFMADMACQEAANSFSEAVQSFVNDVVKSNEFLLFVQKCQKQQ